MRKGISSIQVSSQLLSHAMMQHTLSHTCKEQPSATSYKMAQGAIKSIRPHTCHEIVLQETPSGVQSESLEVRSEGSTQLPAARFHESKKQENTLSNVSRKADFSDIQLDHPNLQQMGRGHTVVTSCPELPQPDAKCDLGPPRAPASETRVEQSRHCARWAEETSLAGMGSDIEGSTYSVASDHETAWDLVGANADSHIPSEEAASDGSSERSGSNLQESDCSEEASDESSSQLGTAEYSAGSLLWGREQHPQEINSASTADNGSLHTKVDQPDLFDGTTIQAHVSIPCLTATTPALVGRDVNVRSPSLGYRCHDTTELKSICSEGRLHRDAQAIVVTAQGSDHSICLNDGYTTSGPHGSAREAQSLSCRAAMDAMSSLAGCERISSHTSRFYVRHFFPNLIQVKYGGKLNRTERILIFNKDSKPFLQIQIFEESTTNSDYHLTPPVNFYDLKEIPSKHRGLVLTSEYPNPVSHKHVAASLNLIGSEQIHPIHHKGITTMAEAYQLQKVNELDYEYLDEHLEDLGQLIYVLAPTVNLPALKQSAVSAVRISASQTGLLMVTNSSRTFNNIRSYVNHRVLQTYANQKILTPTTTVTNDTPTCSSATELTKNVSLGGVSPPIDAANASINGIAESVTNDENCWEYRISDWIESNIHHVLALKITVILQALSTISNGIQVRTTVERLNQHIVRPGVQGGLRLCCLARWVLTRLVPTKKSMLVLPEIYLKVNLQLWTRIRHIIIVCAYASRRSIRNFVVYVKKILYGAASYRNAKYVVFCCLLVVLYRVWMACTLDDPFIPISDYGREIAGWRKSMITQYLKSVVESKSSPGYN